MADNKYQPKKFSDFTKVTDPEGCTFAGFNGSEDIQIDFSDMTPLFGVTGETGNSTTLAINQQSWTANANKSNIVTIRSKNLFNPLDPDIIRGYRYGASGQLIKDSNYLITGKIPISEGQKQTRNWGIGGGGITWQFDSEGNRIAGSASSVVNTITGVSNSVYCRWSIGNVSIYDDLNSLNIQIESGELATDFETYYQIREEAINSVDGNKIKNTTVTPQKTTFFDLVVNLFNKNDVTVGKYLNYTNGSLSRINADYTTTGYIDIESFIGEDLYANGHPIEYPLGFFRFLCFYDDANVFVSGFENIYGGKTIPTGVKYVRISFNHVVIPANNYMVMINKLSSGTIKNKYIPEITSVNIARNAVTNNHIAMPVTEMPLAVKNVSLAADAVSEIALPMGNHLWSMSALLTFSVSPSIDSASEVEIGKGRTTYQGGYIRINNDKVRVYNYLNTEILQEEVSHGLTIGTRLMVTINQKYNETVVRMVTESGKFTFTTTKLIGNYNPFVKAIGNEIIVNSLNFDSTDDLSKNILFIGDSYGGGQTVNRWPGCAYLNMNIRSFMTSNMSGGTASVLNELLTTALNYGYPKYVIWGSGMNDNSYSTWLSETTKAINLIRGKGAEPILITIPSVPTRDRSQINTYVRTSGIRYIDMSLAVSDDNGNWFAGMLDSDGVHPTELGAFALAMRALTDFPELLK
ncbi:SGNH/GDSL hydrolase family protein [Dysgonomonas sp. Marseille-P4677]|uniref:SGNH/GDSL hydrolase family protein n=1 Tax=Dysgonomonas sp. Marseille-P4677 TaxID=2364790 RepID=UPI001914AA40|nr:SGNH/GDSL hydrolase family protein [Dysgonomonas sp. Marseille-P4677]MBK5722420.1 SGNH/GDSL hydrolase family protein [Dysgonomonas sp. Marseille-P4677]